MFAGELDALAVRAMPRSGGFFAHASREQRAKESVDQFRVARQRRVLIDHDLLLHRRGNCCDARRREKLGEQAYRQDSAARAQTATKGFAGTNACRDSEAHCAIIAPVVSRENPLHFPSAA